MAQGGVVHRAQLRANGIWPDPVRQVVVETTGRVDLDVEFEGGLVVEIDGGHHAQALAAVDDALRQSSVTLTRRLILRIPVLGLRMHEDAFMAQVAQGLEAS